MTTHTCPTCGHTRRVTRPAKATRVERGPRALVFLTRDEQAQLDDQAFRAYCKRVSVYGDARFYALHGANDDTRAEAAALQAELLTRPWTAHDVKRLNALKERSRSARPSTPWRFVVERERADAVTSSEAA